VHGLIDGCFARITAAVHRFEGTINQYTGDGVMALFGAPIAHEDSPRWAMHAALGIQRAIQDYTRTRQDRRGFGLQMWIGVHTGLVVGKIGDDLRMDYTAVGDTTNLAARLQQMARPSSVIVSEATHKAISRFFETVDLGEVPVKGHVPIRAFEVVRPRGRRARLDVAVERGLAPLVGRECKLAMLRDRFREVKAGRGRVVFVASEAGIGKSRFLLEYRRALTEAGEALIWLEGRYIALQALSRRGARTAATPGEGPHGGERAGHHPGDHHGAIGRLGEDGKGTMQLASVIGRQFPGRLLERIAGIAVLEGDLRRERCGMASLPSVLSFAQGDVHAAIPLLERERSGGGL
jgi:hypothetical protein